MGPIAEQYRAPDEKALRIVLDRLDPRALGGRLSPGVRDYRIRRAAQEAKHWPAVGLWAVAIDGKTSRGARRADGTRVHLLRAAGHGGRLLDRLKVDIKYNETSRFTTLLQPLDLVWAS